MADDEACHRADGQGREKGSDIDPHRRRMGTDERELRIDDEDRERAREDGEKQALQRRPQVESAPEKESVEDGLATFSEKTAWKMWKIASLKRGFMNMGSGKLKSKVVNKLFKGWNEERSDLEFSKKTFNEMWKERFKV